MATASVRADIAPDSVNNSNCFLSGIKPPVPLNLQTNRVENWSLWKQQWSNYVVISRLNSQSIDYQTAMLLNSIGTDALKIYNGFAFDNGDTRDIATILKKFDEQIIGELNETYERYKFNSRKQATGERFDMYLTELRHLAKNCNFCNCLCDTLLRDRIVMGIHDNETRKRLLEMKDLTLDRCVDVCRAYEATETRMQSIATEKPLEEVHSVRRALPRLHPKKIYDGDRTHKPNRKPNARDTCKFCGQQHEMKKELCPAWGRVCSGCGCRNHFAVCCKTGKRRVHAVSVEQSDSEDEIVNGVTSIHSVYREDTPTKRLLFAKMRIGRELVKLQLDCGASVNLISARHVPAAELTPSTKILQMWDKSLKTPLGECRVRMVNPANEKRYAVLFTVVAEDLMPVLGANACQQMNLITVNKENIRQVTALENKVDLIDEYKDVFNDDVGCFPGEVHLETDPTVQPVISPPRKVPFALKPRLKIELGNLTAKGVIAPVTEPTDWVSSMAIATKKSGELRICIDPRPLNKSLRREHYHLPTLDDVLPDLSKARIITTMDLRAGYWHVKLDDESSNLTTFTTPYGRYKWLRLPFGTSVSAEIFAKRLYDCVHDLSGIVCIADDLMIYGVGRTDDEATRDHDLKLEKLLQRCREVGIRLNASKMSLRQKSVTFLGHVITQDGLQPDPAKIEAIKEMPSPTDVTGVQRLNGFVNYLAKFLPGLSDVMEPIRQRLNGFVNYLAKFLPGLSDVMEPIRQLTRKNVASLLRNERRTRSIRWNRFPGRTRCSTSQPEEHPKRANPFVTPRNRWMPTQSKRMPLLAEHDRRHQRLHFSLRCMPNVRDSEPTGNSDEPRHSRSPLGKDWHRSILQQRQGLSRDCRLLQ